MNSKHNIVTRFAPSPTGFLHIGGIRTALYNFLFAKKNHGKYLLRIEDTDRKRSTDDAVKAIVDGLKWVGLSPDEEPIFQHKNQERHVEIANKLIEDGHAYKCWDNEDEILRQKNEAIKKRKTFKFRSSWRKKDSSEELNTPFVIRFKTPEEGNVIIDDEVQGNISFPIDNFDDLILLRSDGSPTYMLSVVVDDHDMGITHVIRGDDHLMNTPKQKLLYEALNWNIPSFSHIPLIHGEDGSKMSKRHGALGVDHYQESGFLAHAIINYLLRLGWSHGDQEIFTKDEMIDLFSLKKIRKSSSRFDLKKLEDINSHYVREMNEEDLINEMGKGLTNLPKDKLNILKMLLPEIAKRSKTINDLKENSDFIINDVPLNLSGEAQEVLTKKSISMLKKLKHRLEALKRWNINELKEIIENFSNDENLKLREVLLPLRAAITGRLSSIGIYDVLYYLNKEHTLKRINEALDNVRKE